MDRKNKRARLVLLASLFLAMMLVYVVRLVQLQLIHGQDYLDQVESTYASRIKIGAARGEITDRYGRVLAGNETENNVILEKAYIADKNLNQTVLDLAMLLQDCDTEWIDNLPLLLEKDGSLSFKENSERATETLKSFLDLQSYATAQNCMDALIRRFSLDDEEKGWTLEEMRLIAGVRYEMERKGFSVSNNYTFAEDIDYKTMIRVKEASYRIDGLNVEQVPDRVYYSGTLVPHIIGTIGPIYAEEAKELLAQGYALNEKVGKSGIESWAEKYLRGKSGVREVVRNKNGDVISDNVIREAEAGAAVSLTIDSAFQAYVQSALERHVANIREKYDFAADAEGAAVVVLDVNSFEVLASATYPNYDINDYLTNYASLLEVEYNPLYNRVTQAAYRPGSVFKSVVAAIALDEGTISANSTVYCNHIYNFYPDLAMQCLGWHDDTNAAKALRYSCNIFFYDVGRRLGIEKLSTAATEYFGIGVKTGIQAPESAGVMSSPAVKEAQQGISWYPGDTLQASIGQMDTLVTPLQMAVYTATIANGGTRKEVSVVHEIMPADYEGAPLWSNPQRILSTFENKNKALDTVHTGMISAARAYGNFRSLGFEVAAKTGSPQITNTTSFGTFISFAPADNPQIAIAVVGEKMTHGYVLGDLCNDIYQYYFHERGGIDPAPNDNVLLS
ncbi:MAG: hypothetical protein IJC85_03750 [Oscillospiraceae bacterium]|nr:hypothetical protein [Oscillospiraceae bacterium]